jgi:hypothetical protein
MKAINYRNITRDVIIKNTIAATNMLVVMKIGVKS